MLDLFFAHLLSYRHILNCNDFVKYKFVNSNHSVKYRSYSLALSMKIKSQTCMKLVFIIADTYQIAKKSKKFKININKKLKCLTGFCFNKSINMVLLRINLNVFFHLSGRKDFIYTKLEWGLMLFRPHYFYQVICDICDMYLSKWYQR